MKKALFVFCIAVVAVTLAVARTAAAQPRALGDLGKPADYDKTLKHFRNVMSDFRSFVNELPAEFDWRDLEKVTPPKDQGLCGSCWAFASVGVMESKLLIKGLPAEDLSEQQQISCNTIASGCNGGDLSALRYWETIGPMREACTGYPSRDGSNYPCSKISRLPHSAMELHKLLHGAPDRRGDEGLSLYRRSGCFQI